MANFKCRVIFASSATLPLSPHMDNIQLHKKIALLLCNFWHFSSFLNSFELFSHIFCVQIFQAPSCARAILQAFYISVCWPAQLASVTKCIGLQFMNFEAYIWCKCGITIVTGIIFLLNWSVGHIILNWLNVFIKPDFFHFYFQSFCSNLQLFIVIWYLF